MQTTCPKCLALISDDAMQCPKCGATEASLSAEAASARANRLPSSNPLKLRWKRESILISKVLIVGFPLYLVFLWLLRTVLGGYYGGWTLPF